MKILGLLLMGLFVAACDLRQHIADAPANLGDFIAYRVPALLAEPDSEIYEFASIIDYGPPGSMQFADINEYMMFSDLSDFRVEGQVLSSARREDGDMVVEETKSFVLNTREHVVEAGETAFSISRKYNMPLARLAIINNLSEPYSLRVGQRLRVENAEVVTTTTETPRAEMAAARADTAGAAATTTAPRPSAPATAGTAASAVPARGATQAVRAAPARTPQIEARAGTGFVWPVRGRVVSEFGPKPSGLRNDGINIAAPLGTDVVAADNGVVAYAGNELKGMGNLLIIQHQGGWMTVYAHLDSFVVRRGDRVRQNQKVGTVGQTGRVNTPQLHFEIRRGSQAFDPRRHLRN